MTAPETPTPTIWYLGSMNDGLFIINQPPRPSNDDVFPDRDGPTVALPVHGLTIKQAQAVCDAHNAIVTCQAEALRGLLACYEEFQASSGNMEEAYYKLAKYAYPQWQAARAALSRRCHCRKLLLRSPGSGSGTGGGACLDEND
jgi:hypothetical protein